MVAEAPKISRDVPASPEKKKGEPEKPKSPEDVLAEMKEKIAEGSKSVTDETEKAKLEKKLSALKEIHTASEEERLAKARLALTRGSLSPDEFKEIKQALDVRKEEYAKEIALMTYRLESGDFGASKIAEGWELSQEMKDRTERLMKTREALIKTEQDAITLRQTIEQLKKERDRMERSGDPKLGEVEYKLQVAENELKKAIGGIELRKNEFKAAKEAVKAQLMTEFSQKKEKIIKKDREAFLNDPDIQEKLKVFRAKYKIAEGKKLTEKQKEKFIKEVLQEETIDHAVRVIFETIKQFDESFERERHDRVEGVREKSMKEKLLGQWRNASTAKRVALSGLIAAGTGAGVAAFLPATVAATTMAAMGTGLFLGFRAVRGVAGWFGGKFLNKLGQNFLENVGSEKKILGMEMGGGYGKKRAKARQEQMQETKTSLHDVVKDSKDWLKNEKKKLALAEKLDQDIDAYRKKIEELGKKSGRERLLMGFLTGLVAGGVVAYGSDWLAGKYTGTGGFWDQKPKGPPDTSKEPEAPKAGEAPKPKEAVLPSNRDSEWPEEGLGELEPRAVPAAPEAIAPVPDFETLKGKIDSIWRASESQLQNRLGAKWGTLNEAQRTHLIDQIKDIIVKDTSKFIEGEFANVDSLPAGTKINFSEIFAEGKLDSYLAGAMRLSPPQMESIVENNRLLREWVRAHPGEQLTSDKVEEILRGAGAKGGTGTVETGTKPFGDTRAQTEVMPGGNTNPSSYYPEFEDASRTQPPVEQPAETATKPFGDTQAKVETTPAGTDATETGTKGPEGYGTDDTVAAGDEKAEELVSKKEVPQAPLKNETPFGTAIESTIAKKLDFLPDQYNRVRGLTVEKLLSQIPADEDGKLQMWNDFNRGRAPDLPHGNVLGFLGYPEWELRKQVRLAEYLRGLKLDASEQKMAIGELLNRRGAR